MEAVEENATIIFSFSRKLLLSIQLKSERASKEQRTIFRFMKNRCEKSRDHEKLMKKMRKKEGEEKHQEMQFTRHEMPINIKH